MRLGRGTVVPLIISAVVLSACSGGGESARASTGGGPSGAARSIPVAGVAAEIGTISRAITVSGTVEPIRVVGVNSRAAGEILALEVEEGDVVAAGAVLVRLDDREVRAELRSAQAALEVARDAFERSSELRETQVVTQAEYDRDRAALAAAVARAEQLETRAEYSTIRSPLAGVVTEKLIEVGDIVGTQARLFTIADVSTLVVRVAVSELDVIELAEGDATAITLDAAPDRRLSGRVRRVFPTADPTTRLVPVEVALESASAARPGFLARVTFDLDEREGVVLVPAQALMGAQSAEYVYVVENERAERRPVTSGLTSNGRVEIRSNLEAGEVVIVSGQNMIREGATVQVVDPVTPTPPATIEGAVELDSGETAGGASGAEQVGGSTETGDGS